MPTAFMDFNVILVPLLERNKFHLNDNCFSVESILKEKLQVNNDITVSLKRQFMSF